MKIKVSKNYQWCKTIEESDTHRLFRGENFTYSSSSMATWEDMDVDIDQLHELIYKGYAIRINC